MSIFVFVRYARLEQTPFLTCFLVLKYNKNRFLSTASLQIVDKTHQMLISY